ncbi:MAG: DUF2510 domain-containing protein [Coriobacteriia bacterium]|nr:DUF2510 domain-containing protein [Coriobacteriia bacterium]
MSRYVNDLVTGLGAERTGQVASQYLSSEGFTYRDERGEMVWRKGTGAATIPQFLKFEPREGAVRIEAWVSMVALVPGVYGGEQDLTGFYGWAIKGALKKRVAELERRLTAEAPAGAVATAAPSTPAGWYDDPEGRHQSRYWDGGCWTENCADDGVAVVDPV